MVGGGAEAGLRLGLPLRLTTLDRIAPELEDQFREPTSACLATCLARARNSYCPLRVPFGAWAGSTCFAVVLIGAHADDVEPLDQCHARQSVG